MTGPHCDVGEALLLVENEAWTAYRATRDAGALERASLAADLFRGPKEMH
jgi:hypothetical protein